MQLRSICVAKLTVNIDQVPLLSGMPTPPPPTPAQTAIATAAAAAAVIAAGDMLADDAADFFPGLPMMGDPRSKY